jgi:hypothetical protein
VDAGQSRRDQQHSHGCSNASVPLYRIFQHIKLVLIALAQIGMQVVPVRR